MDLFSRKIEADELIDFQPFFIYKELQFDIGVPVQYFNFELEYGFMYLLNQVSFSGSSHGTADPTKLKGPPNIEFINSLRGRTAQDEPVPLRLFSSPGLSDSAVKDQVEPLKNRLYQNYFYQFSQTIETKISREKVSEADVIDLMFTGYLIADTELGQWQ